MAVIGCGTMGSGIAILCADAGLDTTVVESTQSRAREGMKRIDAYFAQSVAKGKATEQEKRDRIDRIHPTSELGQTAECDFIIEAVPEDLVMKKRLFGELHHICKKDALLLTNTSTLSITAIASGCGRPDKVAGMHFCNPAPIMPMIEIARGLHTSNETFDRVKSLCSSLGKKFVVAKDTPGFLTNFFLVSFVLDAVRLLEGGMASAQDIDKACKLGLGHPMGPFELMDTAGLDITCTVAESLYDQTKDTRYVPPALLRQMVDAGLLGRKSGRGFYEYGSSGIYGA